MPIDFTDLVPANKRSNAPKQGGVVGFLNRHADIPKKVLDFIPKVGETTVRTGAAALLGAAGYGTPEQRLAFVKEPFTSGGKSLPEHAIEIQAQGEQTLPAKLRPIAKALGPTTAAGAELAAGFGDPLNLALAFGAMPGVSAAEAILGVAEKPDLLPPNLLKPRIGATVTLKAPKASEAIPAAIQAEKALPEATKAATAAASDTEKASPFTLLRMRDRVAEKLPATLKPSISRVSMRGAGTVAEAERRLHAALPADVTEGVHALISAKAEEALAEGRARAVVRGTPLDNVAEALSPKQAKRLFKAQQRTYANDLKRLNKTDVKASARRLVAPKAPEFKNVLPPGKRPITLPAPGSEPFPLDIIRSAPVKDPSPFSLQRETLDRNLESVFGPNAKAVQAYLSEPLKQDVTAATETATGLRKSLERVFKGLKIRRGSKDDFLAADFIEGKYSIEQLKKLTSERRTEAIVQAAEAGRVIYRDLLERINAVLRSFGYKPVPERQNYVTHTRQIGSFLDRLGNLIAGGRETLPTEISAINVETKPGRGFFAFGKRRRGDSTHEGLITALDKYIDPAVRQIHVTPSIQRIRAFQRSLVKLATGADPDTRKFSNFNSYLEQLANALAGKQNIIDRPVEKVFGRKFLRAFDGLRRRTGANLVGGSVSAALTNYIPLTQSLATTSKPAAIRGLYEALFSPFKDPTLVDGVKSAFLTRRFPKTDLAPTLAARGKNAASGLFKLVDRFTSQAIVGGKFYEGVRAGLTPEKAMAIADDFGARIMADRSLGQQPLLFNSKTLGALTQFQVEVNNQVSVLLKDIPKNFRLNRRQAASALTQVAIYSYLFNELYERVAGRRPALDPIHVFVNTVGRFREGTDLKGIANPADQNTPVGEIVNNLPFASIFTGGRVPVGSSLPDIFALLRGESSVSTELQKPLYGLLPPTSGNQIRKTIKGIQAFRRGYSATPSGKYRFDTPEDPLTLVRSALFGEYATPQAREYFKSK